ncbi:MAG: hypothetical protein ACRDJV_06165 [Actinomycetota bacterium]
MSARLAILLFAVLAAPLFTRSVAVAEGGHMPSSTDIVAQEEETEGQDGGGAEEETGAGQGETQETPAEAGPPWTYQMARIGGVLVLLLLAGIGWWYYRLVVRRQRGEI